MKLTVPNTSMDYSLLDYDEESEDDNMTYEGGGGGSDLMVKRDALYVVVPMTCMYALILVSGLVGNISTCVVIARNKHMHTPTNYYLFSLAVSDLLLLVVGLPPEMYYIWSRYPYVFGEFFCRLTGFAQETSANATVLTITAFTMERYVAICHPFLTYTSYSNLSRAVKYIIAIWALALCLAVPQAIQFGVVPFEDGNGTVIPDTEQCTLKYEFIEHSFHISTFVFFVVPMTVITILYVLIGLKLRRSRLLKRPSTGSSDRANNRHQNHVVRMLVAVVVAFFICWAPFHCQRLLAVYGKSTDQPSKALVVIYTALTYISGLLYFLSTTINPLLYHTMSNKFRQAFKNTLSQICSPSHENGYPVRDYSVLIKNGPQKHLGSMHHSSVSCTFKEVPLQRFAEKRTSMTAMNSLAPTTIKPGVNRKLRLLPRAYLSADTISNTSLQDVDGTEFTRHELARYMGELNQL